MKCRGAEVMAGMVSKSVLFKRTAQTGMLVLKGAAERCGRSSDSREDSRKAYGNQLKQVLRVTEQGNMLLYSRA